ncbi:MAG: archease [Elusimicrobia bacterium]|nr:archease [Candidatus Liberimonas magnetica]
MKTAMVTETARKNKKFSFFSHTADAGMRVCGKNIRQVFENAAKGLNDYLKIRINKRKLKVKIKLKGNSYEGLIVQWLNELLYIIYSKRVIFTSYRLIELTERSLKAEATARKLLEGSHFSREIKAVTYHNIKIVKTKNGYSTKLIFDI